MEPYRSVSKLPPRKAPRGHETNCLALLQLSRLPQPSRTMMSPSKIASPRKIPLTEKSPNIAQRHTRSPDTPVNKRPSILGPAPPAPPVFAIHEEDVLRASQLRGPNVPAPVALLGGGAKRKIAETGIKPPASKRMTLADRAAAPKQFAAKPTDITCSVSANLTVKTPAKNVLSSTVGPGAARAPAGRPIAQPRSRVASAAGLSKSVGPTTRSRTTPAPAANRPPSRDESAPPPSREVPAQSTAPAFKPKRPAWDTKGRLEDMELAYMELKEKLDGTTCEKDNMNDLLASERARLLELETSRARLQVEKEQLQNELRDSERRKVMDIDSLKTVTAAEKSQLSTELSSLQLRYAESQTHLQTLRREHEIEKQDSVRRHRQEEDSLRRDFQREIETVTRTLKAQTEEVEKRGKERLEDEMRRHERETRDLRDREGAERNSLERRIEEQEKEIRKLKGDIVNLRAELEREQAFNRQLKSTVTEQSAAGLTQEATTRALRTKLESLETIALNRDARIKELEEALAEATSAKDEIQEKLRAEESIRRKLHNQIQELKGNIRVFCRVRPALSHETADGGAKLAEIRFPDATGEGREIECVEDKGESSMGKEIIKNYPFQFDKVFTPGTENNVIFEEISQLVQSALDGYNVCIFAYGQTGSGKTYTMSSPKDGMIPQAVHQIYSVAESLKEKGWKYTMEGSFLEIYNENINDLLGKPEEFDKKKHEIKHDTQRGKTTVTDLTTVNLDSSAIVSQLLDRASGNRSVAATKANERSSRSHSVFILKLAGSNAATGERSEGVLNLIDLAGSERLAHSQSAGDRLRETQAINKSLSCLGDVIYALGNAKDGGHVPYRNSKLTYLLQYSLGGNSKTLMFVNVSPLKQHLSETLCSLRFATKVNNTQIGTAKKNKSA